MRGRLFVVAAPSGAGKTSLVRALLEREPELRLSISHTTRTRRPTEEHGREYYFVSREEFERLRAQGEFLESAEVFDNLYGTGRGPVDAQLTQGKDVILEIDWQGARQVRAAMKDDCVSIFILPPSRRALEERLRNRKTDSEAVIARRLRDAVGDMRHYGEFDYAVVNDRFEDAITALQLIVQGEGDPYRADRPELRGLLKELLA